jgi:hypothetical protein
MFQNGGGDVTKYKEMAHPNFVNYAKGQLISEWNFGVFKSPKKRTFFGGFLP